MSEEIIDRLANAAWGVLNHDNDPKCEPEGPANWKLLKSRLRDAMAVQTTAQMKHGNYQYRIAELEKENVELSTVASRQTATVLELRLQIVRLTEENEELRKKLTAQSGCA